MLRSASLAFWIRSFTSNRCSKSVISLGAISAMWTLGSLKILGHGRAGGHQQGRWNRHPPMPVQTSNDHAVARHLLDRLHQKITCRLPSRFPNKIGKNLSESRHHIGTHPKP